MSLTPNRSLSAKVKESDKKEDRYDENVNALFEENGLYRKKLPKDSDSLMKAVSDALYFTTNHHTDIQEILLKHLTQLIASDKLTPRLSSFQGNSMMLKDFCNNPQLPGFEKTNLELICLLFKVRVVLYTMSEEHILTATIFNHNYLNTIELFRTKTSHYNAVFTRNFIEKSGVCQNILLNLIDRAVNGKSAEWKDINKDQYVNLTYESSVANAAAEAKEKETGSLDQFRITRGHHKKSLSDNFNTNFEFMEEQQMKFYDAFMSAAPPDDFLKNFDKMRKDTAESNFSINANFDFIDDQALDSPFNGKEFAIKNYVMPSNGLSPRASAGLELDSPMPAFTKAKFTNQSNILFNENLTLAEIERLENTINTATTQDSKQQLGVSPFYRPVSPPGLSPTKFSQRSFNDSIQTSKSELFSPSPVLSRDMQSMSPTYPYSSNSPTKRGVQPFAQNYQAQRQFSDSQMQQFAPQSQQLNTQSQAFTLQSQQYNQMYMKRTASAMQTQSDAFNMRPQQTGYDQTSGYDYDQSGDFGQDYDGMGYNGEYNNGMVREKKKPIILDESQERYYGRLKFFDENKKYGFIVMEDDGSDIFVHYDDLCKANITKDLLRTARMGNMIRLNFGCMAYIGKYNKSRKAIDIQLVM